jgi:DNA mismatch repair protein MutL
VSRIRRLPDHLVNKIAAGEVVERPASVVKELVENALDAGARSITIDLRDGGAALVRVADDGCGMTAEDLALALERHATSKLALDGDLDAIGTLGFRGEALPAICAVTRWAITSRAADAVDGTRMAGEGETVVQRLAVPADVGTTVEVSDLFFNTPARLKFLKSPAAEVAACVRAATQLAVAHREVRFRVTSNGRTSFGAPAARDLRERMGALWGWETAERLLAVEHGDRGVTVEGLAAPPDVARGGRDDVIVVVNGRPVRDPALLQTIVAAYRPMLPRDRFPVVALLVRLPLADVDVNVHPTKAWVRFRHARLVHAVIADALGTALRRRPVVPAVDTAPERPITFAAPSEIEQAPLFAETPAPYGAGELGTVLGQVQDTFIVAASDREVFFVDQHAAHERVLFERLAADLEAGRPPAQTLLFPQPLALGPAGVALLESWRAPLEGLGFAFDGFGGDTIVLRAVPALLEGDEPARLVEAAVDDLAGAKPGEPVLERVLSFVACRAAVKAGAPLEREQMERLVSELAATNAPYFCPHGRPTMSRVSLADVRRDVRRLW